MARGSSTTWSVGDPRTNTNAEIAKPTRTLRAGVNGHNLNSEWIGSQARPAGAEATFGAAEMPTPGLGEKPNFL